MTDFSFYSILIAACLSAVGLMAVLTAKIFEHCERVEAWCREMGAVMD